MNPPLRLNERRLGTLATAARWVEMLALYAGVPTVIWRVGMGPVLIPFLVLSSLLLGVLLALDPSFDRRQFLGFRRMVREAPRLMLFGVAVFGVLLLLTWLVSQQAWAPEEIELFGLLKHRPGLLAAIIVLYPVFSVYPQEIIFRTWFFHRYAPIVRSPAVLVVLNALAFGYAHVFFDHPHVPWDNVIAVGACVVAGVFFAITYLRTRSTMAAALEHALYGDLMWLAGLGSLFYLGASQQGVGG